MWQVCFLRTRYSNFNAPTAHTRFTWVLSKTQIFEPHPRLYEEFDLILMHGVFENMFPKIQEQE